MGKKATAAKGKRAATANETTADGKRRRAAALDKKRREDVVFFPSNIDAGTLKARYAYMWGRVIPKGHGAPVVLLAGSQDPPDSYRFFCAYFLSGLTPPYSEFVGAMMTVYGFHLLDFTPNAVACMAIFAHLCEDFIGVTPNVDLFRHFFILRIEDKAHRSGNISWIP